MSVYKRVLPEADTDRGERIGLDERFLTIFLDETPQDRVEAQELRQIVSRALQELTDDEMAVVEQRYQYKRSPGQVASKLGLDRETMSRLEASGLQKLREPLREYMGK